MEQNNNKNTTTTTTAEKTNIFKGNTVWETTLASLEEWRIARRNLDIWLDEAEKGTFGSFFESKTNRTAPFSLQNLAIVAHTSSGYIGDLVRKAKTAGMEKALKEHVAFDEPSCYITLILDTLAPNLAEERAKRAARLAEITAKWENRINVILKTARSVAETWDEFGIPKTVESVAKIAPKYLQKEFGKEILATLAAETLDPSTRPEIAVMLGCPEDETYVKKCEYLNSYRVNDADLFDIPQWFIEEEEQPNS